MAAVLIMFAFIVGFIFLKPKNRKYSTRNVALSEVDSMNGHDFEYFCADLLKYDGFNRISVTKGSNDQGVDIIAYKKGVKYAIQCKRYQSSLGNKPVQEVNTGRTIYGCSRAAVMTNSYFTKGAIQAANATGVLLWDRVKLDSLIRAKQHGRSVKTDWSLNLNSNTKHVLVVVCATIILIAMVSGAINDGISNEDDGISHDIDNTTLQAGNTLVGTDNPFVGIDSTLGESGSLPGGTYIPLGGTEIPGGGEENPTGGEEDPTGGEEDPTGGAEDPSGGAEDPSGGAEIPLGERQLGIYDTAKFDQVAFTITKMTFARHNGNIKYLDMAEGDLVNCCVYASVENQGESTIDLNQYDVTLHCDSVEYDQMVIENPEFLFYHQALSPHDSLEGLVIDFQIPKDQQYSNSRIEIAVASSDGQQAVWVLR